MDQKLPSTSSSASSGPIADLTYRNYDGPMELPTHRWWAIAKLCIRLATKKRGFWIASVISGYWYLILAAVFFFVDLQTQGSPLGVKNPIFANIVWKDQFLNAFSISQLLLFICALMLGAGAIANDNRAKALLVYLSKPCTKTDYLVGKWMSIFIPITGVVAVPTILFYGYCLMSYRTYGFWTDDPFLLPKLLGMILVPGFFHASVVLGISSLFDQGRMAGATYAGMYFIGLFFTKAMQVIHIVNSRHDRPVPFVDTLYYMSVDGLQIGFAKIILNTQGSTLFPIPQGPSQAARQPLIEIPSVGLILSLYFGISFLAMWLAWSRVRAVEVVG